MYTMYKPCKVIPTAMRAFDVQRLSMPTCTISVRTGPMALKRLLLNRNKMKSDE